jgi:ABC-type Fe3+ transport system permease subunit
VFVDNSQLPSSSVTIVSDSSNYYVSFSFTFHSPAQIDIQLTGPENAASPTILGLNSTLFYAVIGALVAVVVVVIAVLVVRRRPSNVSNPQQTR